MYLSVSLSRLTANLSIIYHPTVCVSFVRPHTYIHLSLSTREHNSFDLISLPTIYDRHLYTAPEKQIDPVCHETY